MSMYGNRGLGLGRISGWFRARLRRETSKPAIEPEELAGSNLPEEQQDEAAGRLREDEAAERAESATP